MLNRIHLNTVDLSVTAGEYAHSDGRPGFITLDLWQATDAAVILFLTAEQAADIIEALSSALAPSSAARADLRECVPA